MVLEKELNKSMEVLRLLGLFPVWVFDQGGYIGKLIVTMITAVITSHLLFICDYTLMAFNFIDAHIFNDWSIIRLFMIAFSLDFISGIFKHVKLGSFSTRLGLWKVIEKGFICLVFIILGNTLGETINIKGNVGGEYVKLLFYVSAMVYVALSACANIYVISSGKFPPKFIMARLNGFYKTGDVDQLKKKDLEG
jgi:phage-related holin